MRPTYLLAILFLIQCSKVEYISDVEYKNPPDEEFNQYWYQGLAELNSYELEQVRYGQLHKGEAVLIFVTEDVSKSKQVKLDNPQAAKDDAVKVLKLNATKKFLTGIYPYSLMMSVFTPVYQQENPRSLKVSTTTQDWCGHTFEQLNLKKNKFAVQVNSYFESEGDKQYDVDNVLLEDEVWNMIRLNPENLPTGNIKIIPATFFARLKHRESEVVSAKASLESVGDGLSTYSLSYPQYNRVLKITFEKEFPHKITAFEEELQSGYGANQKTLTTTAKLKETIQLDYWNKHNNEDRKYRAELGL